MAERGYINGFTDQGAASVFLSLEILAGKQGGHDYEQGKESRKQSDYAV